MNDTTDINVIKKQQIEHATELLKRVIEEDPAANLIVAWVFSSENPAAYEYYYPLFMAFRDRHLS